MGTGMERIGQTAGPIAPGRTVARLNLLFLGLLTTTLIPHFPFGFIERDTSPFSTNRTTSTIYTTDTQPQILNTSRKQRGRCSQLAGTKTCCRGSHHVYAVESGRLLRVRERVVGRERRSSLRRTTQRVARWTPIPWCSTFLPWFCARGRLTARDASRRTPRNQPATGS